MKEKLIGNLPVEAYFSQEWFDQEMKTIFSNTWQFAGLVEDVQNPGDCISVTAGLNNVLVVKNAKGELKAFHNLCRHRGTPILRTKANGKNVITCPYHDWAYNLEGELISVPERKKEFPHLGHPLKICGLNLIPAQVGVFRGMIFVHPDVNTASLESYFKGVEQHLGPHDVTQLEEYSEESEGPVYQVEIAANWKIIVENYIDQYHLSHLHKDTLDMYDHKKAKFGWEGRHYWFQEPLTLAYLKDVESSSPYPLIPGLKKENLAAYVPWFFPNIGISESESTWSTFHLKPLAPNKTLVSVRTKVPKVSMTEWAKQYAKSSLHHFWKGYSSTNTSEEPLSSGDFMMEDIFVCEELQKSIQSPYFEVGAWAKKGEQAILQFQNHVKEAIHEFSDKA